MVTGDIWGKPKTPLENISPWLRCSLISITKTREALIKLPEQRGSNPLQRAIMIFGGRVKSYQDKLNNPPEKKRKKYDWNLVLDLCLFVIGVIGVSWYILTDQDNIHLVIIFTTLFFVIKTFQIKNERD